MNRQERIKQRLFDKEYLTTYNASYKKYEKAE